MVVVDGLFYGVVNGKKVWVVFFENWYVESFGLFNNVVIVNCVIIMCVFVIVIVFNDEYDRGFEDNS